MHDNAILITGIIRGDEQILKKFYSDNMKYIRGYILRNFGNTEDVEDVFQDALVVLYQKLKAGILEISVPLRTYFYGICKNIWRNTLRRKVKTTFTNTLHYFEKEGDTSLMTAIENDEKELVYRKHFEKLSSDKKRILTLYFEGKSMREIAEITGYTEKYARKKKYHIKKELLTMISQDPKFEACINA